MSSKEAQRRVEARRSPLAWTGARGAVAVSAHLIFGVVSFEACALPSFRIDPSLDPPPPPVPVKCGGFAATDADCGRCIEQSCCAQASACHDDPSCDPLYRCLFACAVPKEPVDAGMATPADICRSDCFATFRGGASSDVNRHIVSQPELDFASCRASNCASCGAGRGLYEGYRADCAACVRTTCADELAACSADRTCSDYMYHRSRCLNPWCVLLYPEPAPPLLAAKVAAESRCATECVGGNWSCTGNYAFPRALDANGTLSLHLTDFVSGAELPGIAVSACRRIDSECVAPLTTKTADDHGNVALEVPLETFGFTGFLLATGASVVPTIFSWNWPLYQSITRPTFAIPTPSAAQLLSAKVSGPTPDPARGHIGFDIGDCSAYHGVGLRVTLSAEGTIYYFDKGVPSVSLTATSADGVAVAINVPPGSTTATIADAATGQVIAKFPVLVRAGTWNLVEVLPSPAVSP